MACAIPPFDGSLGPEEELREEQVGFICRSLGECL